MSEKLSKGQLDLLERIAAGQQYRWNTFTLILRDFTGKAVRIEHRPLIDKGLLRYFDTDRNVIKRLLITDAGRKALEGGE